MAYLIILAYGKAIIKAYTETGHVGANIMAITAEQIGTMQSVALVE